MSESRRATHLSSYSSDSEPEKKHRRQRSFLAGSKSLENFHSERSRNQEIENSTTIDEPIKMNHGRRYTPLYQVSTRNATSPVFVPSSQVPLSQQQQQHSGYSHSLQQPLNAGPGPLRVCRSPSHASLQQQQQPGDFASPMQQHSMHGGNMNAPSRQGTLKEPVNYDWFYKGGTIGRGATVRSNRSGFTSTIARTFSKSSQYITDTLKRQNLSRFGTTKIAFLIFNSLWVMIGIALLVYGILTFSNSHSYARLILMVEPLLFYVTFAAALIMALGGLVGYYGAFTHQKSLIVMHICFIVPVFGCLIYLGYAAHRVHNSNMWSYSSAAMWDSLTSQNQVYLQNRFKCCGGTSPIDSPNPDSAHCKALQTTASLAGCLLDYTLFGLRYSRIVYTAAFSYIPFTALIFIVSILSVNHIYD